MKNWRTVAHADATAAAPQGFPLPGAILAIAVLLGLLLRCFGLGSHELQYDEAATGYFAALPWSDLWAGPAALEPNPPLFYSLARLVMDAGGSVEQIRYISVAAGVLCIPLAWAIARDLAGASAAAGTALLVATSPQHIAISQYGRAYAFLILCLMCAFVCLLHARHSAVAPPKDRSWKVRPRRVGWWWPGYVVSGVAALYTHHTAIVVLAALNVAVLIVFVRADDAGRRFLKPWLVANLLVASLYAPWLPILVGQIHPAVHPSAATPSAGAVQVAILQRLWNTISNPFPFAGLPWLDVWLLPVILLGVWRFRLSREVAFLWMFALGGLLLMLLASQFRPLLDGKTLTWASAFAMVAAAVGCSAAGRFRLPLLLLVILIEARSVLTALYPAPEGWREVAATLRENAMPQDVLYVNYAASVLPLRHYGWSDAGIDIRVFAKTDEEPWFRGHVWPIVAPQAVAGGALQEHLQGRRVWLLSYGKVPPDQIANEIAATSVRALHRRTERLDLSLFQPVTPAPAAAPTAAAVSP
jgi:4-amino-4-deoxy-L-arabinose transferase-like glycosyltransferase